VSSRAIVAAQLQTSRFVLLGGIPILFMSQYAIALFGKQFAGAELIIGLLIVATMIQGVAAVTGPFLMATNRMKTAFYVNLSYALTLIAATFLLSPRYGATGLAIGYILAYTMPTLWVTFTLRRELPDRFTFYIYICLAFIASLAAVYFASPKCLRPLAVIPASILALYLTSHKFRDKVLFPDSK
jgi:O-antigen/teichoic acid export membrane protein